MLPSTQHPEQSSKVLLFFTKKEIIYDYIYNQICKIISRICCPSWMTAIVDYVSTIYNIQNNFPLWPHTLLLLQNLDIDWNSITYLTLAEGFQAALQVKLTTASLLLMHIHNVRHITFLPIVTGREDYLRQLTNENFTIHPAELQIMYELAEQL